MVELTGLRKGQQAVLFAALVAKVSGTMLVWGEGAATHVTATELIGDPSCVSGEQSGLSLVMLLISCKSGSGKASIGFMLELLMCKVGFLLTTLCLS